MSDKINVLKAINKSLINSAIEMGFNFGLVSTDTKIMFTFSNEALAIDSEIQNQGNIKLELDFKEDGLELEISRAGSFEVEALEIANRVEKAIRLALGRKSLDGAIDGLLKSILSEINKLDDGEPCDCKNCTAERENEAKEAAEKE